MRKEIKRSFAILIACCLLMGVLCASFAEETADFPVNESNSVTIEESAAIEVPADPVKDREEADAPSIPEMNGEPAETEPEPQAGKTAVVRAWITEKQGENEAVILKANVKPVLEGKVTWQVHNENWQEDKWEEIGNGEQITLDSAKVSNGSLVRFLLEDGTVSEIYEVTITKQEEPAAEEPITEEPVTEEPTAEEPVMEEPAADEPATEEPVIDESATEEPAAEESVTEEPTTEEPTTEEPTAEEPVTEEPAKDEPAVEETAAEEPVAEEPAAEEPVTEEPTTEEPATEEATTEEPTTEEPATEEPATDEPVTEEPAAEEPTTDEPAAEEPTTEEPT